MQSSNSETQAYPLRFDPIFQYRLWGGRGLKNWITGSFPDTDNIGEAWLLSDRADNPSLVADGPLKGRSLAEIMEQAPGMLMGEAAPRFKRFPLLLKYLDVAKMLSVQVHPADTDYDLIPPGETGKTEAWLILEAKPGSRVYAGLKPGVTKSDLRSLSQETVEKILPSFTPQAGQCIAIEAGTVHSLGDGVTVLEVQQNSDVTYRLYDWDHLDPQTGSPRPLQIDQALQCLKIGQQSIHPIIPVVESTGTIHLENLVTNPYFQMNRVKSSIPFDVGSPAGPTVLFCVEGSGRIEHSGPDTVMAKGNLILMPAALSTCRFRPACSTTIIEFTVPSPA